MIHWIVSVCLGLAAFGAHGPAQEPAAAQNVSETNKPSKADQNPPKQEKTAAPSLDDLLGQALKNNPDIRVAEAKVRETEAELNRTRLLVTQKVVTLQKAIEVQKGSVEQAEQRFRTGSRLLGDASKGGALSKEEFTDSQQKLAQAKGKLSEMEAELAFLTGKSPQTKDATTKLYSVDLAPFRTSHDFVNSFEWSALPRTLDMTRSRLVFPPQHFPPTPAAPGSAADKLRKALDTQVEVKFDSNPLHDVLRFLEDSASGISFRILDPNDRDKEVNLELKGKVSVGAVLQALEDSFVQGGSELRFVVRDYGILVTWADKVPPGALRVESLWKAERTPAADKSTEPDKTKKEKQSDKPQ